MQISLDQEIEIIYGTKDENFELALKMDQFIAENPKDPFVKIAVKKLIYYLECAARIERGIRHITKSNYAH